MENERFDLAAIRDRLSKRQGKHFWRSLDEVANTKEFQKFLVQEFPDGADQWLDSLSRRNFLKLMGASFALAGLAACRAQPPEKILPYNDAPEQIVPGQAMFFATAVQFQGIATGVLVESHMGRPTKIEGNPDHPASLGATDAFTQASILTMYDPDRSQLVLKDGALADWDQFLSALTPVLDNLGSGAGLRLLTETITSPTLAQQVQDLLAKYPDAKWHQYEPFGRDSARIGTKLAFGEAVDTQYQLDKAKVILSLDSDFLVTGPGSVRYARDFIDGRQVTGTTAGNGHGEEDSHSEHGVEVEMNRLYAVESIPTGTGTLADHRLSLKAGQVEAFARAIAQGLGISAATGGSDAGHPKWLEAVVEDLKEHGSESVVIPGEFQSPAIHVLAHAINNALGSNAVTYTDSVEANPVNQIESFGELVDDMKAGTVEALVIIDGNPVFNAPADHPFADHIANVPFSVHLGLYEDETAKQCAWHIPGTHFLEAWGDARAYNGLASIVQPLIEPLYSGKSAIELLAVLLGKPDSSGYDIVRAYWESRNLTDDFDVFWQTSLHNGFLEGTAFSPKSVTANVSSLPDAASTDGLEVIFRPDPTIWDGRLANNGWLQELPKPLTKLTWDNAALVSPTTAEQLGLSTNDLVDLSFNGRTVQAPVWIMPGHAQETVTVIVGYGRSEAGQVGTGVGTNTYGLRASDAPWFGTGLEIKKIGTYPLVTTQLHHDMNGRNLVRVGTVEEFSENPGFVHEMDHHVEMSLYPEHSYKGYAWGMTVNTGACNGCNACVMACQAENNIPIVGKSEVSNKREMHWMRIDRYYEGELDNPDTMHQPVMCQHCEGAPCEVVCPAAATVHSREGLNDMVYNRCVGTRYCMNNCPYKVRRFNFFQYTDAESPSLDLMRNPNVSVRSRGVVEKCSYCVQRINAARINAKKEDRLIHDGEIQTACQSVCPTNAIVFGNIKDDHSQVAQLKADALNYTILGTFNFQPRTSYLAKLTNPNPKLEEA